MARPLRIEYPGALYHVTSRGNARHKIFKTDKDRLYFIELLGIIADRFRWLCYAYCLMDNHYHLVIETQEANLANGMRQLNGVYTQKYNRKYQKTGHVFQGRYKAIIVDRDSYFLELCRYVVLNPVRAHAVEKAEDWKWSSYRAAAGSADAPPFLATDGILGLFSKKKTRACELYRKFVAKGLSGTSPWQELKDQIYLGDAPFIGKIKNLRSREKTNREIPRAQREAAKPDLGHLFDVPTRADRNKAMYVAHVVHRYTLRQIGDHVGLHYTTVSRIIRDEQRKMLQ
jgi:REP element-mobilizing transposase RayT